MTDQQYDFAPRRGAPDQWIADTIDAPQMLGRVVFPAPQIDDPDLP